MENGLFSFPLDHNPFPDNNNNLNPKLSITGTMVTDWTGTMS